MCRRCSRKSYRVHLVHSVQPSIHLLPGLGHGDRDAQTYHSSPPPLPESHGLEVGDANYHSGYFTLCYKPPRYELEVMVLSTQ